jgi:hypothetical protein
VEQEQQDWQASPRSSPLKVLFQPLLVMELLSAGVTKKLVAVLQKRLTVLLRFFPMMASSELATMAANRSIASWPSVVGTAGKESVFTEMSLGVSLKPSRALAHRHVQTSRLN